MAQSESLQVAVGLVDLSLSGPMPFRGMALYLCAEAMVASLAAWLLAVAALVADSPCLSGHVLSKELLLSMVDRLKLRLTACSLPLQALGLCTLI